MIEMAENTVTIAIFLYRSFHPAKVSIHTGIYASKTDISAAVSI
jgi:hypothetical protein